MFFAWLTALFNATVSHINYRRNALKRIQMISTSSFEILWIKLSNSSYNIFSEKKQNVLNFFYSKSELKSRDSFDKLELFVMNQYIYSCLLDLTVISISSELGSYSSALLCPSCKSPVVSKNVLDIKSDWSCSKCGKVFPSSKIANVTGAIKEQAEKLDYNKEKPDQCGVKAHEAFLKKYKPVLHPNHVLLVKAKYSLAKMYGRMEGFEANKLTEQQLKRKQAELQRRSSKILLG